MTAHDKPNLSNEALRRAFMKYFDGSVDHQVKKIIINRRTLVEYSLDLGGNRYRSSHFTLQEFADIADCSTRTALRWLDSGDLPRWLPILLALLSGALVPFEAFAGFHLSNDGITTPGGHTLSPGALESLAWRNQENRALWRRISDQADEMKRLQVGMDYWREKAGAPIAANDED